MYTSNFENILFTFLNSNVITSLNKLSFICLEQLHRWQSGRKICLPVQEMQELRLCSLSREDPLEEEMATHSSILVGKIPWTEEPGGLQSMGLQRVGHNWSTHTYHTARVLSSKCRKN